VAERHPQRVTVPEKCDPLLPRCAGPRFVERLDERPKTATGKVQRAVLRQRGIGSAWDRGRTSWSGCMLRSQEAGTVLGKLLPRIDRGRYLAEIGRCL